MMQMSLSFVQVKKPKKVFNSEKIARKRFRAKNPHCDFVWNRYKQLFLSCPVIQFMDVKTWVSVTEEIRKESLSIFYDRKG
jgi:hypothetical protein